MLTNEGGKITSRLAPLVRTQDKQLYELLHSWTQKSDNEPRSRVELLRLEMNRNIVNGAPI